MMSVAFRRVCFAGRGFSAHSTITRAVSTASGESSDLSTFSRLEPSKWFSEMDDPAVRSQMNKLREIEDDLIATASEETEAVDWDEWEKTVKYPGLVQELKKIHESMPLPDVQEERKRVEKSMTEAFTPMIAELRKMASDAEEETVELEKRAEEIHYLRDNINELTVDEFLEKYPAVKASIEDDVANNRWYVRE